MFPSDNVDFSQPTLFRARTFAVTALLRCIGISRGTTPTVSRAAAALLLALASVTIAPTLRAAEPAKLHAGGENRLLAEVLAGRKSSGDLLGAAIACDGTAVSPSRLTAFAADGAGLHAERLTGTTADWQRLFEHLHARWLRGGYDQDASQVGESLDSGRYNCLSGVVLFVQLARSAGLTADVVTAPGHVWCEIVPADGTAGERMAVELTCPTWFRLAPTTRARLLAAHRLGDAAGPTRRLGDAELLGLIYYNHGVTALARADFAAAAVANRQALRLDPQNAAARDNLVATLNNWAVSHLRAGEVTAALELLAVARLIAPEAESLRGNERYAQRQLERTASATIGSP